MEGQLNDSYASHVLHGHVDVRGRSLVEYFSSRDYGLVRRNLHTTAELIVWRRHRRHVLKDPQPPALLDEAQARVFADCPLIKVKSLYPKTGVVSDGIKPQRGAQFFAEFGDCGASWLL